MHAHWHAAYTIDWYIRSFCSWVVPPSPPMCVCVASRLAFVFYLFRILVRSHQISVPYVLLFSLASDTLPRKILPTHPFPPPSSAKNNWSRKVISRNLHRRTGSRPLGPFPWRRCRPPSSSWPRTCTTTFESWIERDKKKKKKKQNEKKQYIHGSITVRGRHTYI